MQSCSRQSFFLDLFTRMWPLLNFFCLVVPMKKVSPSNSFLNTLFDWRILFINLIKAYRRRKGNLFDDGSYIGNEL